MEFAKLDIGNVQAKTITAKEASKAVASAGASETAYWRRFRAPVFLKEHAPITSIHYVPSSPLATTGNEAVAGERAVANPLFASVPGASSVPSASQAAQRYAVTAGPRVQLFSTRTDKVVKTVSRFTDVARSGHIRADGRLMVAGDDSGLIQVFDINSRAILRTFRGHKQYVVRARSHQYSPPRPRRSASPTPPFHPPHNPSRPHFAGALLLLYTVLCSSR